MNDYTNSIQGKGFLAPSHEDISSDHSQISSAIGARNQLGAKRALIPTLQA